MRPLGIPTVGDRIAQTVVKMVLEPVVEPHFHEDSYGYRPGKSAHDAVGAARKRCWRADWVIDLDIKGFFDNLDHDLVLKAVDHHTDNPWVRLYISRPRWLRAPAEMPDGTRVERMFPCPESLHSNALIPLPHLPVSQPSGSARIQGDQDGDHHKFPLRRRPALG